jgi:50S ribosomal protein L16 3-hydroxylase
MLGSLESLISPMKMEDFYKYYESNTPFVINGSSDITPKLTSHRFLKSINSLFESWPKKVNVHLPDLLDESSSIDVSTQDARKMFRNGSPLLFNDANDHCDLLNSFLTNLIDELGLSKMTYGRNLLYLTPKGYGAEPHFDQNINFILQIHGSKTWRISRNTQVYNPLTRHRIGCEPDAELASYLNCELPQEMPSDYEEYNLAPGSLLFLPRGAWHSTLATEDALSINFTLSAPTWIDILTAALRGRLAQSPYWRETADYVNSKYDNCIAIEKFDMLLSELAHDVKRWKAEDILGATEASL